MAIKRNYRRRITFNPLSGEFDYITVPRSPTVDRVTNSEVTPLSALQVVYYTSDSTVGLADSTDLSKSYVAGIANNAANNGDSLDVVVDGPISDSGWTWTPGLPIFVNSSGGLTQTAPVSPENRVQVGHAISATEIDVNIEEPICLL